MIELLRKVAENPYLNLVSGIILFFTAGCEIVRTFGDGTIGAHHGVAFFGLTQIIQSLPYILDGSDHVSKIRS